MTVIVHVPESNNDVHLCPGVALNPPLVRSMIYDWLNDHTHGIWISDSWGDFVRDGPNAHRWRWLGTEFRFQYVTDAIYFKLAWGGQ